MSLIDISNSISLLEELLNEKKIFEITTPHINVKRLIKKFEKNNLSSSEESTTYVNDSITIKDVVIPSELWNKDSSSLETSKN